MTEQLQFLNEISKSVLSKSNTEEAMKNLLKRQLTYFDAERALVFELDRKQEAGTISYMVCADGASSSDVTGQQIRFTEMSHWAERCV